MTKFNIGQRVQIVRWLRSTARLASLGEPHGGFLEEIRVGDTVKTYWGGTIRETRAVQGALVYTLGGTAKYRGSGGAAAPGGMKTAQYYEDELEAVGELPVAASRDKAASRNQ